jgi:hypothetical protein
MLSTRTPSWPLDSGMLPVARKRADLYFVRIESSGTGALHLVLSIGLCVRVCVCVCLCTCSGIWNVIGQLMKAFFFFWRHASARIYL